jgi:hypothetical protein
MARANRPYEHVHSGVFEIKPLGPEGIQYVSRYINDYGKEVCYAFGTNKNVAAPSLRVFDNMVYNNTDPPQHK